MSRTNAESAKEGESRIQKRIRARDGSAQARAVSDLCLSQRKDSIRQRGAGDVGRGVAISTSLPRALPMSCSRRRTHITKCRFSWAATPFEIGTMTRDDHTPSDVDRPSAIVAVGALGVVGSIVFTLLPLLVGAFTTLSLDRKQVGFLGSADMAGMFLAAAVATWWVRELDWRRVGALATALLVGSHLLSGVVETFVPLLLVRVVAGFAGGSLMSIALTSLGDTRKPDRWFALFISGQLGLGAVGLWLLPSLLEELGLRGAFWALALLTALAAVSLPYIPRQGRLRAGHDHSSAKAVSTIPGLLSLAGCLVFNLGIMAVWAYAERIGDAAGLEASTIGRALGTSLLAGLFGALLAAALVDRFGRGLPIVASALLQLVALVLIAGQPSVATYTVGVMLFSFCWNFPVAYQLAITVEVDRGGRLVVLFLSAVKLGYAIGPALAGQLIALGGSFAPVLIMAGLCFVASGGLYAVLARLGASEDPILVTPTQRTPSAGPWLGSGDSGEDP